MKIHILNDLHIEFANFMIPETDADVIVLAGDIGIGVGGLEWLKTQDIDKPIIYVPGNHEFYYHDISLVNTLKSQAENNVYVLDNDMVVIDDVRFLGSILWTDFALFGEVNKYFAINNARRNMSDFSLIKNGDDVFRPEDSIKLHEDSRGWLSCMLSDTHPDKTVVVTHHAPSPCSVHPRYANNLLTPAFVSRLDELMGGERVNLWLHGHTHDAFDYEIFGTRVICNPRGYAPYELSTDFIPDLVVEV